MSIKLKLCEMYAMPMLWITAKEEEEENDSLSRQHCMMDTRQKERSTMTRDSKSLLSIEYDFAGEKAIFLPSKLTRSLQRLLRNCPREAAQSGKSAGCCPIKVHHCCWSFI
mmetsp:Transcript_41015/g.98896  ORF Transcript_41015/g.98896 Transcript_41015/m.98896 type:complete len:111 (-) Transcript_41015:229-561(-)